MVTIKDIAKIAGVSHTTVSRALNDSPLIKPATKKKIGEIARSLNYTPNVNAKSLVNHKSYIIGLYFSNLSAGTSDRFLVEVIKGINTTLPPEYRLVVRDMTTVSSPVEDLPRMDGIIVMSQSDQDDAFIEQLSQLNLPIVVLNRQIDRSTLLNVTSNDSQGVYQAIKHAIESGYKKFAIIEGKPTFRSSMERKRGFLQALHEYNLTFRKEYAQIGDYSIESGRECTKQLLALSDPPEVIFCSNDDMAIGAINTCLEEGLNIPADVAIIGFDNIPFSKYTNPPLTTISKPVFEMSQLGAQLLLEAINGPVTTKQYLLDTELITRQSL
jgi:LacI family transcriptional regulator